MLSNCARTRGEFIVRDHEASFVLHQNLLARARPRRSGAACGDDDSGDDGDEGGGAARCRRSAATMTRGALDAGDDDAASRMRAPSRTPGPRPAPNLGARRLRHRWARPDGRVPPRRQDTCAGVAAAADRRHRAAGPTPERQPAGNYDFSRNGDIVALPTDLEVPGRYDLYAGPSDGSALNQVGRHDRERRRVKVRVSPDGNLIAFIADLEVDQLLRPTWFRPTRSARRPR